MRNLLTAIGDTGEWREGGREKIEKYRLILPFLIFMFGIRLFFSIFSDDSKAWIGTNARNKEKIILARIDPLNRLEKGFLDDKCQNSSTLCESLFKREQLSIPEQEDYDLVQNYPIEEMLPTIKKLDQKTANYLIAIAKKESNWGKRAPSKNGQDCYNYWGYKGGGEDQVLGYSCFSTREEAIEKVGGRIEKLIEKGLDTPQKMLVWKCGSSCAGHDPQGVRKWVADVESVLKSIKS